MYTCYSEILWRKLPYPTLEKGKSIFKMPLKGDMLVPWRVSHVILQKVSFTQELRKKNFPQRLLKQCLLGIFGHVLPPVITPPKVTWLAGKSTMNEDLFSCISDQKWWVFQPVMLVFRGVLPQGDGDVYAKTAADQKEVTGAIDAFGSVRGAQVQLRKLLRSTYPTPRMQNCGKITVLA